MWYCHYIELVRAHICGVGRFFLIYTYLFVFANFQPIVRPFGFVAPRSAEPGPERPSLLVLRGYQAAAGARSASALARCGSAVVAPRSLAAAPGPARAGARLQSAAPTSQVCPKTWRSMVNQWQYLFDLLTLWCYPHIVLISLKLFFVSSVIILLAKNYSKLSNVKQHYFFHLTLK